MNKTVVLKPHLSEKAYGLSKHRVYIFEVPVRSNRLSVASAVIDQFNVNVDSVNIAVVKGKPKRALSRGRSVKGQRTDNKRAYVTLAEGQSLPFFEEVEKAAVEEQKAEAKAKEEVAKHANQPIKAETKPKRGLRNVFSHKERQTQFKGGEK